MGMRRRHRDSRQSNRTILLTGFEPFGGAERNPSQEIARALDGRAIAGRRVVGAVLPCVFGRAGTELQRLLRKHQSAVVVCLGLAESRAEITPERVAINVDDARIPDNGGQAPADRPVIRGAPAAYWSTLPVKAMVAALHSRGVPASVSNSAGTFVCNHVFFRLLHALRRRPGVRGGFVHLPPVMEGGDALAGGPGLPLETMVEAVAVLLDVAVRDRRRRRA
jgi:pyroglutamyl-peptidase